MSGRRYGRGIAALPSHIAAAVVYKRYEVLGYAIVGLDGI